MESTTNKIQSNKPYISPFHQQKLKDWQPIIDTNNLYLLFFTLGIIFIVIGSSLIYFSHKVNELNIDYTDCVDIDSIKCSERLISGNYTSLYTSCLCSINITIVNEIKSPAYVYYGLTNFFQNHRDYVKSLDDRQLKGITNNFKNDLSTDCEPFRYYNRSTFTSYAPCGSIANSLFNDTFRLEYITNNNTLQPVSWTKKGIAWKAESDIQYGEPFSWANTVKPINWPKTAQERSSSSYRGDEELLVWLSSAALPKFKKLHRIIGNQQSSMSSALPKGRYVLHVNYSFPVTAFEGTKTFIISETNYMGGKNPAMGIIYLVVGIIYFSLAIAFLFINAFVARRYVITDEEKPGRQKVAWFLDSHSDISGCSNETFCQVEDGDQSVLVDHCVSRNNLM